MFIARVLCLCLLTTAITCDHLVTYIGNNHIITLTSQSHKQPSHAHINLLRAKPLTSQCDVIVFPPLGNEIVLQDALKNVSVSDLRMTYLGDGVVHVMDRQSGLYVVRKCNDMSSPMNPCPVYASGRDPYLHTPFKSMFSAGQNRVIVYDHVTGEYNLLFFDHDVHGSGAVFRQYDGSIFSGKFSFSGDADFAHITTHNNTREFMVILHKQRHEMEVYAFSSDAHEHEQLLGLRIAKGHVTNQNFTSLKPMGENRVMLYGQSTGVFQLLEFVMVDDESLEIVLVRQGDLTFGHPCSDLKSKSECTRVPTCGWCLSLGGCRQLSGHTTNTSVQFCDGSVCEKPKEDALPVATRIPSLYIDSNSPFDAPSITPLISLPLREYLDSLENDDESQELTNAQLEAQTINWFSNLPAQATPTRIQKFYVPPPSISLNCMNSESDSCGEEFESQVRALTSTRHDALQPRLYVSDKDEHPTQPLNLADPMNSMSPEFMDDDDHVDKSIIEMIPPEAGHVTHPIMNNGVKSYVKSDFEDCDDVGDQVMHSAMTNAENPHYDHVDGQDPKIAGGSSQTPSPSPSISNSPSPSTTQMPSPSPSPSSAPSITPTMRAYPCPGIGDENNGILYCGKCELYHWTPRDLETHLLRIPTPDCVEGGLLLTQTESQVTPPSQNAPRQGPRVDMTIIQRSQQARPNPPSPQQ